MSDLISRQTAIDAIRGEIEINGYSHVVDVLEQLLSAQPKRGKWIDTKGDTEWYAREYECSECGGTMLGESNFCPNCGADMRGEKDIE